MFIFIINIMDSGPTARYKIKGKGIDKRKKSTRKIQCPKSLQSHLPNAVLGIAADCKPNKSHRVMRMPERLMWSWLPLWELHDPESSESSAMLFHCTLRPHLTVASFVNNGVPGSKTSAEHIDKSHWQKTEAQTNLKEIIKLSSEKGGNWSFDLSPHSVMRQQRPRKVKLPLWAS